MEISDLDVAKQMVCIRLQTHPNKPPIRENRSSAYVPDLKCQVWSQYKALPGRSGLTPC